MVGFIDYLAVALVLRRLFSAVSEAVANVMLALVAVSVPLSLAALAQWMDVLSLLDGGPGLPAVGTDQWQLQIMLALR